MQHYHTIASFVCLLFQYMYIYLIIYFLKVISHHQFLYRIVFEKSFLWFLSFSAFRSHQQHYCFIGGQQQQKWKTKKKKKEIDEKWCKCQTFDSLNFHDCFHFCSMFYLHIFSFLWALAFTRKEEKLIITSCIVWAHGKWKTSAFHWSMCKRHWIQLTDPFILKVQHNFVDCFIYCFTNVTVTIDVLMLSFNWFRLFFSFFFSYSIHSLYFNTTAMIFTL